MSDEGGKTFVVTIPNHAGPLVYGMVPLAHERSDRLHKTQAIRVAASLCLARKQPIQIVDLQTGKVYNVNAVVGNPNVTFVSADASNPCGF